MAGQRGGPFVRRPDPAGVLPVAAGVPLPDLVWVRYRVTLPSYCI